MIAVRKTIPAFADYNNRELIKTENPHLFVFIRNNPFQLNDNVLVVGNFNNLPQYFSLSELGQRGFFEYQYLQDLYSGESISIVEDKLIIPPYCFYWLSQVI
jgi:amylosucrase